MIIKEAQSAPQPPAVRDRSDRRRRRLGVLLALAIVPVIVLCGLTVRDAARGARLLRGDPDQIASDARLMAFGVSRGKAVYDRHCASCHEGGRARAEAQAPDLSDQDYLYGQGLVSTLGGAGLVSDNERIVQYGVRAPNSRTWNLAEMPAYGTPRPARSEPTIQPLKPGEIDNVVEYLRRLEARPFDAAGAARGAQIYAGRGGCYDCHASDAQGDPAIGAPDLTDRTWLHGDGDRKALANVIAHGSRGVCPAWVGRLSALRIREVALYVYSLSHRHAATSRK